MSLLGDAYIRIRPDTRGFSGEANRSIGGAMKSVAKAGALAFAAGAAGATVALAGMAKQAIADQQAAALLARQLKASAGATDAQVKATERWITAQGKAFGVTDDDLRPALAKLVGATHDVGKAQKLASLAMDVSAGTGKDLGAVSTALMKAQNGQVSSLSRLGINTKNAAGETISMKDAVKRMSDQFGGAAKTKAETLQGQMTRLSVRFSEAGEAIGYKLLPMLTKIADWIFAKVIPAVTQFGNYIKTNVVPVIKEFAGEMAARLGPVLAQVRDVVAKFLPVLQTYAHMIIDTVLPAVIGLGKYLFDKLAPVFEQVAKVVVTRVIPILVALGKFFYGQLIPAIVAIVAQIAKNLKPVFDQLVVTFQTKVMPAITKLLIKFEEWRPTLQTVILWVVKIVGAVLKFAAVILAKVLPVVIRFVGFLIAKLVPAIIKVIDWMIKIGKAIVVVWNHVIEPVLKAWWAYMSHVLFPIIKFLYDHVVKPTFKAIGDVVKAVWNNSVKPTFTALKTGVGAIKDAFKNAVAKIKTAWNGLKEAARAPVAFVVNTVYNNGIRKVVNAIPGVGDLPEIHMATGGVLPGFTPGRDIHEFVSRNGMKLHLSGGEGIIVPEAVRDLGGPLAVARINKMARTGTLRRNGDLGSFARGGTLDPNRVNAAMGFAQSQVGKPYHMGGIGPGSYDCSGFMSAITNVLRGQNPYSRVGTTASFPWAGFKSGPGEFTIGSANPFPGSSFGHMAGTLQGTNVESSGGVGVHMGATARGWNSAGFNTFAHLGNDGTGTIWGDLIGKVKDLWSQMHAALAKLTSMGDWGDLMKKAVTSIAGSLRDYLNGKIPGPGPLPSFDRGGVGRGRGSMLKNTIRPERVLSGRQTELIDRMVTALERNGGATSPLVNVEHMHVRDETAAARAIERNQRNALAIASLG